MNRRISLALASLCLFSACTRKSASSTKDLATTSSFKSGFFMPRSITEFSVLNQKTPDPISLQEFSRRAQLAMGKPLELKSGFSHAVTAFGDNEMVLMIFRLNVAPTPIFSLDKFGRLYSWHVYAQGGVKPENLSNIFLRSPYGQKPVEKVDNLFVYRQVENNAGFTEPVVIPWNKHLRSETLAGATVFLIGNAICDANSGRAIIEFQKLGAAPVWMVYGPYRDADVEGGTVFWKVDEQSYYSYTKNSQTITKWMRQDGDSLDRVTTVAKNSVRIPTIAQTAINNLPAIENPQHPARQMPTSFNTSFSDIGIIHLERNNKTILNSGVSLVGRQYKEQSVVEEKDYKPVEVQAFKLENGKTAPLGQNYPTPEGSAAYDVGIRNNLSYQHPTLGKTGGPVLKTYTERERVMYDVYDSTKGTVYKVNQYGAVVGQGTALSLYEAQQSELAYRQNTMNRERFDTEIKGPDFKEAGELKSLSEKRLEQSQGYLPGRNALDYGGAVLLGVGKDTAINAVPTYVKPLMIPVANAAEGAGKKYIQTDGEAPLVDLGEAALGNGAYGTGKNYAKDILKEEIKTLGREELKQIGYGAGTVIAIVENKDKITSGNALDTFLGSTTIASEAGSEYVKSYIGMAKEIPLVGVPIGAITGAAGGAIKQAGNIANGSATSVAGLTNAYGMQEAEKNIVDRLSSTVNSVPAADRASSLLEARQQEVQNAIQQQGNVPVEPSPEADYSPADSEEE